MMQVCSNLNQCFCNVGFTGSSCSDTTTGPGGSTGSPGTVFVIKPHTCYFSKPYMYINVLQSVGGMPTTEKQ